MAAPLSDVAEASLTSNSAMMAAPEVLFSNQYSSVSGTSLAQSPNLGNELLASLGLPSSLRNLPAECYLTLAVLSVATLALLFARRGSIRHSTNPGAQSAPVFPGLALWPPPVAAERESIDDSVASNHAGATAGTIMATVGLAVLAVGIVALVRGHLFGQFMLRRPGLFIAAVGQGILLLGLVAQAVYRSRQAVRPRNIASPNSSANPIWPSVIPIVPLSAGFAWPASMPVVASSVTNCRLHCRDSWAAKPLGESPANF
jgi:hypothetical protein